MKLGLVLEGGASRTYFSVGAMDALLDINIHANYVIGASAGIANGISYVSRQHGRNLEIGTKYLPDKRYMGFSHFLNLKNRSFYNIDFVFNQIPNKYLPFDYAAFVNSGSEVYAAVTDIESGECKYLPVTGNDKKWSIIVASCALPLLFRPIKIDGKRYMDGGITDSIPIKKALEDGCDKLIVILTRERGYKKEDESAIALCSFLYKKYPKLIAALKNRADMYNECHKTALELEKEGKLLLIAPDETDGWHRTERNHEEIQKLYDLGYKAVIDRRDEIKKYLL